MTSINKHAGRDNIKGVSPKDSKNFLKLPTELEFSDYLTTL